MSYWREQRPSPKRDERWEKIDKLLAPFWPASNICRLLKERYGIEITLRTPYNWRRSGVSEDCAAAVADMTGRTVEYVLKISGKL